MADYKKLDVWNRAMNLAVDVYRRTEAMPREERFGLTAQIRDCAASVPSNISEGSGRQGTGELLNFAGYSKGSLFELETRLLLAERLGYLTDLKDVFEEIEAIGRMLSALQNSLREKRSPRKPSH